MRAPRHRPFIAAYAQRAVKSAAAKTFFDTTGSDAWTTTPDKLTKFQAAETLKWGKVIKSAGIEPE